MATAKIRTRRSRQFMWPPLSLTLPRACAPGQTTVQSGQDIYQAGYPNDVYDIKRASEAPKVAPLTAEPAQSQRRALGGAGARLSPRKTKWRRAGSNSRPRDYETLALAN
jgi:hypothetical protein